MINSENNKMFCVYMHTNKINGKRYVGITCQKPEKRWENGNGYTKRQTHIYNAIQKYGWENFEHIILIENISIEHANSLEQLLIKVWKLQDPQYGYNLQSGGSEYSYHSQETRKKMSESAKGKPKSEEHKKKISESKKGKPLPEGVLEKAVVSIKGKPFSESHKRKISESLTGIKFSDDHKIHISESKKGKTQSEKQKEALAIVCEQNKGRKHTESARAKISAGNKGKIMKNSVTIGQYDIITQDLISIYKSIMYAHNETGISYNGIWECINKGRKDAGGFNWKIINN